MKELHDKTNIEEEQVHIHIMTQDTEATGENEDKL